MGKTNSSSLSNSHKTPFDPNLLEYTGSQGFAHQLWEGANKFSNRRDFLESIGLVDASASDDEIQMLQTKINFMVWSNFTLRFFKQAQSDDVIKMMQQQEDELSKIDSPPDHRKNETEQYDENNIPDAELLEKVDKRFGNSLPLHKMNVILLMDMSHKHASL